MTAWIGYLQIVCCLIAVTPTLISGDVLTEPFSLDFGGLERQWSKIEKKFYIHSEDHPKGTEFDVWEVPPHLLTNTETKVITHGYKENREQLQDLVDGYLKEKDMNIITFSWEALANTSELQTGLAAVYFGRFVVGFLIRLLTKKYHIKPEQIHLIGTDMGAHLMGSAARSQIRKIGRITGLNPYGRYFDGKSLFKIPRLSANDATFIDVYHTSGGHSGLSIPIGTVDFYPNGGTSQPKCNEDKSEICNKQMAKEYFAESIEFKDNFWGIECSSYEAFKNNQCNDNPMIIAGEFGNTTAQGIFFFQTNAESPYGQQQNGTSVE